MPKQICPEPWGLSFGAPARQVLRTRDAVAPERCLVTLAGLPGLVSAGLAEGHCSQGGAALPAEGCLPPADPQKAGSAASVSRLNPRVHRHARTWRARRHTCGQPATRERQSPNAQRHGPPAVREAERRGR